MDKEMFKNFHALIGSKIRFTCSTENEAQYEGIVRDLTRSGVNMEHLYFILPDRKYAGSLYFDFCEISSYNVIESSDKIKKYERFDYVADLFSRSYSSKSYSMNVLFNDELDEPDEPGDEERVYADDLKEEEFVLKLPPGFENSLPHDSIILNVIDIDFHQAISYILKREIIGVSFEGAKISRSGKLSWICVSTDACVFLFDIEVLQNKAFDQGLRRVFQSKRIMKVIHDCREAADCLSHVYATEMANVFDTQVADYIVMKQGYKDKYDYDYVSSLDCSLIRHLEVPQEFLRNRKKNFFEGDEENFFAMRPISNEYRNMIIKNSLYLVLLKEKLAKLLLEPFYEAVDIYLNVLANASEDELCLDLSVPDRIPPAVLTKGLKLVCIEGVPEETPYVPLICKFRDPVSGNTIESYSSSESNQQKSLIESKDVENDGKKILTQKSEFCSNNEAIDSGIKKHKVSSTHSSYDNENASFGKECKKVVTFQMKSEKSIAEKKRSLDNSDRAVLGTKPSNIPVKNSVIVNEITMKNCSRKIDRIYCRLVNSHHGDTQASYNIVDVKPSSDYESRFVQKKSLREIYKENSQSGSCASGVDSVSQADYYKTSKSSSDNENSSDVWSKLRAEFADSGTVSENSNDIKKFRLVPAGMS